MHHYFFAANSTEGSVEGFAAEPFLLKAFSKLIEALFPCFTLLFDPIGNHTQFIQTKLAQSFAALLMDNHQSALAQDPEVLGNGRPADGEMLRHRLDGKSSICK